VHPNNNPKTTVGSKVANNGIPQKNQKLDQRIATKR